MAASEAAGNAVCFILVSGNAATTDLLDNAPPLVRFADLAIEIEIAQDMPEPISSTKVC